MPYIPKYLRHNLDKHLNKITAQLQNRDEETLAGELNYCFSRIAWDLFKKRRKYARINTINGAFISAQQEFARRKVAPYEDEKIQENGDL